MRIPFVNLQRQHAELLPELQQSFLSVAESNQLMGGALLETFEKNFAAYTGRKYGVPCGNATDALEIILRALSIGPQDEVIVPANGWLSAAEVVLLLGAKPVFVEPHPLYYTLDLSRVEESISSRTRAIVPIHLYGLPAPMKEICALAEKYGLWVIEDCAQAHGAGIGQKKAGSMGTASAFSFYPTKNLGAMGDGGMILTDDEGLAQRCRALANHGQTSRNVHSLPGRNSRMDALQAAVLQTKLPHLERWNQRRQHIAAYYLEAWRDLPLLLPAIPSAAYQHVFHLFVIRSRQRDKLSQYLAGQGIATEVHYPYALPQMPVFASLQFEQKNFQVAASHAEELLSIPVYPELTDAEVEYIATQVAGGALSFP